MLKRLFCRAALRFAFVVLTCLVASGCDSQIGDLLADVELRLFDSIDRIQTRDPRTVILPQPIVNRGDTIIIRDEVEVIVSIQEQLVIERVPDITLLGLENLTGYDIYLTYLVDGVIQQVFVFSGETLLLQYPCLDAVQLLTEEDYTVFGEFVESFDLAAAYFNPEDFFCGEALIVTIDRFEVSASIETVFLGP